MLIKHFAVFYKNSLAIRSLTRKGAEAKAFELAKLRGWNIADLEVKQDCETTKGDN